VPNEFRILWRSPVGELCPASPPSFARGIAGQLQHSSITVTAGKYVEVIEAVQRDTLDSMASPFCSDAQPGLSS
jgi:hypothetical protein